MSGFSLMSHLLINMRMFLRKFVGEFHSQKSSQKDWKEEFEVAADRNRQTHLSVSVVVLEELKLLENMNPSKQLHCARNKEETLRREVRC